MALLVALTLLVLLTSFAVTRGVRSRAEAVIAVSLVFNAVIILPIYALGLTGHLDRLTLGLSAVMECAALLAFHARRNGGPRQAFRGLPARILSLVILPLVGIRATWQRKSLLGFGAILATALFPYMLLVAYLAPVWRDWDGLWYHEPLVGFTIQNHGFAPVPVPPALEVINGVQRLGEMTQLWFAIYGGRRVVEMANVVFMPLFAASIFVLVRRYVKDVVTGVAWASALILLPGYLRVVQSTLCDPQGHALLLAAAFYVTHPRLDRKNALWAILAMTLAVGVKIWSIVPIGLFSVFLLVRLLRRTKENGRLATFVTISVGLVGVLGMQATTYLRNLVLYKNPVWPMIQYDNPKLGIHWKGVLQVSLEKSRAGIDFNEPFPVFYKKMLALPYAVMGPGHYWQVNDYGFAWSWVVLPLMAVVVATLTFRWVSAAIAVIFKMRARSPEDETLASAMMLCVVACTSLFLSPAAFIARYHVASLGMLAACVAWFVSRWRTARLSQDAALFAQIGSLMMACWGPQSTRWVYLYEPGHVWHWLKTPYPKREVQDIGTVETPRLMVSPVNMTTGLAREREVKAGDVVGYEYIDYVALLWNNDYSNKVVWLKSIGDPLSEANRAGAKWLYTRAGSTLHGQLSKDPAWELVGPLEAESFGVVWRRK